MLVFFFFFFCLRQDFSKKSLAWNPLGRPGSHNLSKMNAFVGYKNERKRPNALGLLDGINGSQGCCLRWKGGQGSLAVWKGYNVYLGVIPHLQYFLFGSKSASVFLNTCSKLVF